jgi:hypothetical protein
MINEIKEFHKIQEQCSNVFLLDENLCLESSYNIINYNIISLSAALKSFENSIYYYNRLFTYFTEISSSILELNKNIEENYDLFTNFFSTISSLSARWSSPIGLFYNEMILMDDWIANKPGTGTDFARNKLTSWLNTNFNVKSFYERQVVVLYVTLYQNVAFNLDKGFTKIKTENCYIDPISVTLNCNEITCPSTIVSGTVCRQPYVEEYWGRGGSGLIVDDSVPYITGDPLSYCTATYTGGFSGNITCQTFGAKTLQISNEFITYDTHCTTSLGLVYKKNTNNTSWEYVKQI